MKELTNIHRQNAIEGSLRVWMFVCPIGFSLFWCGGFLLWENWFSNADAAHWSSRVVELLIYAMAFLIAERRTWQPGKTSVGLALLLQLFSCIESAFGQESVFFATLCGVASGASSVLLILTALSLFARFPEGYCRVAIISSFLCGHILALALLASLGVEAALAQPFILLLGSVVLGGAYYACEAHETHGLSSDIVTCSEDRFGTEDSRSGLKTRSIFGMLRPVRPVIIPAGLIALLCGVATQVFAGGFEGGGADYWFADVGAVIALGILLIVHLLKVEITVETSVLVILPVLALAMLAVTVVPEGNLNDIGMCIRVAFTVVQVLIWVHFAEEVRISGRRSFALFCLVYFFLRLMVLLGRFVGLFASEVLGGQALVNFVSLLAGCWLVVSAGMALASLGEKREPGEFREEDATSPQSHFESKCDLLAEKKRLSPRETMVMTMFAQGRSALYIAEELCISESTVRTHIRRIYSKLDIHSRQELIDAVASTVEPEKRRF